MTIKTEQYNEKQTVTTITLDRPEAYRILKQLVTLGDPFMPITDERRIAWSTETVDSRQDLHIIIKPFNKE